MSLLSRIAASAVLRAIDSSFDQRSVQAGPSQHRLHLLRRPRLPGDQRLRRPAQADRHAEHRPDRQGGDAVRPLRRAELDLRAEPGHGPHRQVQPHQRLLQQHATAGSTARRPPSPSCCRRPATRRRSIGKWHLVTDPTGFDYWHILPGQGVYYNPPMIDNGKRVQARGLRHRHHHRPLARLAEEARQVQAVPADVPAQGAAPRVGAGAAPPRPRQRPQVSRAGDAVRRLRRPRHGRARPGHDDREDHARRSTSSSSPPPQHRRPSRRKEWDAYYEPRNEAFREANLTGQGPRPLEVQPLHARLPRLHQGRRRERRPGARSISTTKGWPRTRSWSTPPTRGSTSASTAGSTSAGSSRNRSARRCWSAGRA